MISAQNHPLRLSGNKLTLFLLLGLGLFVASCGILKKEEIYEEDPIVKPTEEVGVDTVVWENKPDDYPPITKPDGPKPPGWKDPNGNDNNGDPGLTPPDPVDPPDTNPPSSYQGSYNVAVLAPFYTNKSPIGEITSKTSLRTLEFYSGVKMAAERLSNEGININLYAYDTEGSSGRTQSIMGGYEFQNMNLVIGPMRTDPLKTAASKVRGTKTKLVSPWNPKSDISPSNPNYIQVKPSLETHCREIMRNALANHSPSNIVLACRDNASELQALQYLQQAYKDMKGSGAAPLRELKVPPQATFNMMDTKHLMNLGGETVFIIPSWGDEKFIASIMRKIYLDKQSSTVYVYGMPQWKNFDRVGYEYYDKLNLKISETFYVSPGDPQSLSFKQDFYYKFGVVPSEDGYMGYDLMMYFGRMMKEKGTEFQKSLASSPSDDYMHTNFRFAPVGGTEMSPMRYENKFVNILKFVEFDFKPGN